MSKKLKTVIDKTLKEDVGILAWRVVFNGGACMTDEPWWLDQYAAEFTKSVAVYKLLTGTCTLHCS